MKEKPRDFEGNLRKKLEFKISLASMWRGGVVDLIVRGCYEGINCANNWLYELEKANQCVERGVTMVNNR